MMDVLPQRIHDFAWDIFIALKQTFSQLVFCGIQEEDEEYSAVLAQIFFFPIRSAYICYNVTVLFFCC